MPIKNIAPVLIGVFVLIGCGGAHDQRPVAPSLQELQATDANQAWLTMNRILPGTWEAATGERVVRTSYRVISKGSALVENFTTPSGTETLTVMHRDGNAVMLTHYCAQGNQARLRATHATSESVTFEFLDATNVKGDQGVMQKLTFTFHADGFDQESVYLDGNKLEPTMLHFHRTATTN